MSQARSAPRARSAGRSARGGASAPRQTRGVYVQQARNDIFVVMLGIALGSLLLGCLFLVLKLGEYQFQLEPAAASGF